MTEAEQTERNIDEMIRPPLTKVTDDHMLWPDIQMALREVYDPEIPVNVYELGLFHKIEIDFKTNDVYIEMTLTSPACPVAGEMPLMVEEELSMVKGIGNIKVELVWEPAWDPSMMAETAKLQLNIF